MIKNNSNKINNTLFGNIKLLKKVFLHVEKIRIAPYEQILKAWS
jgi:hypothetical protein